MLVCLLSPVSRTSQWVAGQKVGAGLLAKLVDLKNVESKDFEIDSASFWRLYSENL